MFNYPKPRLLSLEFVDPAMVDRRCLAWDSVCHLPPGLLGLICRRCRCHIAKETKPKAVECSPYPRGPYWFCLQCAVVAGLRRRRIQLAKDNHQSRSMILLGISWLCRLPETRVPDWKYSLVLKKLNLYDPQEKLRHEGHCSIYLYQHGTDWHV